MNVTTVKLGASFIVGAIAFGVTLFVLWFLVPACLIGVSSLEANVFCFIKFNMTGIGLVVGILAAGLTLLAMG